MILDKADSQTLLCAHLLLLLLNMLKYERSNIAIKFINVLVLKNGFKDVPYLSCSSLFFFVTTGHNLVLNVEACK